MNTTTSTATSGVRLNDIRLGTGVRLHYAEAGSPNGEPILFLHGYTDSWFSFSLVRPRLPAALRAYALTQRGHGDSERPERGYALGDFATDVVAFLDAMGVGRATVVGHSGSGLIAQKVAIEYPDRVARLVLVCSAVVNETLLDLHKEVQTLTDPVPTQFAREFQESCVYGTLLDGFLETAIAESDKLPARVWHDALAGLVAADTQENLHRIQAPTLVLCADRDTYFPRQEQERLCAAIPNATLRVYEETGHSLHWEQPERFVQDLQTFIRSTPAAARA